MTGLRIPSALARASRTLALDLATGEVVRAFDAAGIPCMVLKGPTMAQRLYDDAPGRRNYGDIDLLVSPARFEAAGRVLGALGFQDSRPGIRASEAAAMQERSWKRDGDAHVVVDLHRGFHNVTEWDTWWEAMAAHRDVLVVEGQAVVVPDVVGCALIAALHASKASGIAKPVEDLRRAIQHFDDETWRQAAELADSLGARGAFVAALLRLPAGGELVDRLGLALADPIALFQATSPARGVNDLARVLASGSWRARARHVGNVVWPSPVILRESRPNAPAGGVGLLVVYFGRLGRMATRLPALGNAWHRANRANRGGSSKRPGRHP
jgi:hypothetical protein